ncbi:DUF6302 family protein [Streptomyces halobius]|uniref:Uncharacterized protein n=1 Tax=Streptomyces halobius TaxID=2879846 RepID=A0ABY4MD51_9ACTN|nr:DUF6302 family protein [Streptomyces halobius]UQA95709.1 hypothetical protein K9S39_31035 [Streptomyces halobius]
MALPARPFVDLLPPAKAEDEEVEYYRERLEDPALIEAGAAVLIDRYALLAVPAAGQRRGGCLPMPDVVTALAVRAVLAGRPGFPDVRLRWSPYLDACHVVEWGERPPVHEDDAAHGRFYGYSAEAIARFEAGHVRPQGGGFSTARLSASAQLMAGSASKVEKEEPSD